MKTYEIPAETSSHWIQADCSLIWGFSTTGSRFIYGLSPIVKCICLYFFLQEENIYSETSEQMLSVKYPFKNSRQAFFENKNIFKLFVQINLSL